MSESPLAGVVVWCVLLTTSRPCFSVFVEWMYPSGGAQG